ncbi:MAG: ATP-binding cassette domain-containing protein [Deltaproteobacteria bacterium]|nr:MAG: ATP-binding cassette domain-containing protein [Deltaproteobacteria bacterium]
MKEKMNIMEIKDLSLSRDPETEFREVSFEIGEGEIISLESDTEERVSALFDVLTGRVLPDKGKVLFLGKDVTGLLPQDLVKVGVARAFSGRNVFLGMTVLQNLQVSFLSSRGEGREFARLLQAPAAENERILSIMRHFGLDEYRDDPAGYIPEGKQLLLDFAMVLLQNPRVLFLDRPSASLDHGERGRVEEAIVNLARGGTGVCVSMGRRFFREEKFNRVLMVTREGVSVRDSGVMMPSK